MNNYTMNIVSLVQMVETLRTQNDMIDQDPTLINRYFASSSVRTDIVAEDVTAAHDALVQVIFTFDSGSPPQKAALFKMLP
jgi:hypothetical protein